jgi:2-polyprenyl-3-methyl-5-hydroxy-6-metoxy-1,4-benzoquinol methylase
MTDTVYENDFQAEIARGERFEFGKNWTRFLSHLNEERIREAEESLKTMLHIDNLDGMTFLDIGCGSGLFSLAAMRLNAKQVLSFDYDPHSVACARELKRRFFSESQSWEIQQGSVLDTDYVNSLGIWDVTYSWGVLHHTGAMWKAITNAATTVKPGGKFFIAIYNDEGLMSKTWIAIKKAYNKLPSSLKFLVLIPSFLYLWIPPLIRDLLLGKPFQSWRRYVSNRGMSPWDDVVDWVGGYPFEVAKVEELFHFCQKQGFQLLDLITTNRLGNNELVFIRSNDR